MKIVLSALLATMVVTSAIAADPKVINPDSTGFKFTDTKVVKSTKIEDQYKTGTCWCFSTNTFFENEILRKTGKEVNLSEMFVVYHCYLDKAIKYIRMDGKINFAEGGSALDVPYVWKNYGMVPDEVYNGLTYGEKHYDQRDMADALTSYVNAISNHKQKKLTPAWIEGFKGILNAYMGPLPTEFTYEGRKYTPKTYAESLPINIDDYIGITSFTHHPFYQPLYLEVADNWLWGSYMNVKLDEMKAIVDNAIDKGYTVEWAADVSEGGFKWRKGYAVLPVEKETPDLKGSDMERWSQMTNKDREEELWDIKGPVEEQKVTQESRQKMFDDKETTDDHGMVIIGKAVDQKGNKYYKVQNSWNTNQLYKGYFYISEPYFLAKTMDIYVNKEAIPAEIAKKIGIK